MLVDLGHSQPVDRFALEIEFNHDYGLVAHDPGIVHRLDGKNLGSGKIRRAAVSVLNMNLAASEKPDVRVQAIVTADDCLHLFGPTESGRVDNTLDTRRASADDIQLDAPNFAVFGSLHWREQWIGVHIDSSATQHNTSGGIDQKVEGKPAQALELNKMAWDKVPQEPDSGRLADELHAIPVERSCRA